MQLIWSVWPKCLAANPPPRLAHHDCPLPGPSDSATSHHPVWPAQSNKRGFPKTPSRTSFRRCRPEPIRRPALGGGADYEQHLAINLVSLRRQFLPHRLSDASVHLLSTTAGKSNVSSQAVHCFPDLQLNNYLEQIRLSVFTQLPSSY